MPFNIHFSVTREEQTRKCVKEARQCRWKVNDLDKFRWLFLTLTSHHDLQNMKHNANTTSFVIYIQNMYSLTYTY